MSIFSEPTLKILNVVRAYHTTRYIGTAGNSWLWPQRDRDTGHCNTSLPYSFSQHHCPMLDPAIIIYCLLHCSCFLPGLPKFTPASSNQFPSLQLSFWKTNMIRNSCSFVSSFVEQAFIDPPWTFPHSLICVCKCAFRLWLYLNWISELDFGPAQLFTCALFTINVSQINLAVICTSHRNDRNDKISQAAVQFYATGQSLDVMCSGNEIWHTPYLAFHRVEQLNGTYFNTAAWEYKHRKIRPLE